MCEVRRAEKISRQQSRFSSALAPGLVRFAVVTKGRSSVRAASFRVDTEDKLGTASALVPFQVRPQARRQACGRRTTKAQQAVDWLSASPKKQSREGCVGRRNVMKWLGRHLIRRRTRGTKLVICK